MCGYIGTLSMQGSTAVILGQLILVPVPPKENRYNQGWGDRGIFTGAEVRPDKTTFILSNIGNFLTWCWISYKKNSMFIGFKSWFKTLALAPRCTKQIPPPPNIHTIPRTCCRFIDSDEFQWMINYLEKSGSDCSEIDPYFLREDGVTPKRCDSGVKKSK